MLVKLFLHFFLNIGHSIVSSPRKDGVSVNRPAASGRVRSDSRRRYLSIHEQVPHQRHGFLQRVPLCRDEGLVLVRQAAWSGHHELSDLVVEVVEGLHRCGRSTGEAAQLE